MGSCQGDCLILTAPARGVLTKKKKRREGEQRKDSQKRDSQTEELGNVVSRESLDGSPLVEWGCAKSVSRRERENLGERYEQSDNVVQYILFP